MVKWIFEELLRFLLVNIICAVGALLVRAIIVDWIMAEIFSKTITTAMPFFIVGVVGGVIVGVLAVGGSYYSDEDDYKNVLFGNPTMSKPPRAVSVYLLILSICAIFAVGAILLVGFCNNIFNALLAINSGWSILYVIFGSFVGISIIFMWGTMAFYKKAICPSCKHIFCLSKAIAGTIQKKTTAHRDVNKRDKVATIGSVDVYAKYKKRESREEIVTCSTYDCQCTICGEQFQQKESQFYTGNWS